eukprot:2597038-Prymnesium_polylepis.2
MSGVPCRGCRATSRVVRNVARQGKVTTRKGFAARHSRPSLGSAHGRAGFRSRLARGHLESGVALV